MEPIPKDEVLLDKVVKGLDCCLTDDDEEILCDRCPYKATDEERRHVDWSCHRDTLRNDALELLSSECWKTLITKWMEGLDDADHG